MAGAILTIVEEGGTRTFPVQNEPVTIGRHTDNLVILTDIKASRFHCVISPAADKGYVLRDLDSRNGTRVNGNLVRTIRLKPDDVITIGKTEMRLTLPTVDPKPLVKRPPHKRVREVPPPAEPAAPTQPPPLPPQPPRPAPAAPPAIPARPPAASDDFEIIDDADVVEVDDDAPIPVESSASDAISVLSGDAEEAMLDLAAASTQDDDERFLPVLAASLPNRDFEAEDIALISTRGQVVHPAIPAPLRANVSPGEAVVALRYLLLVCCRGRATDIHLEPKNEQFQLRLRIDGAMTDVARLGKAMGIRLGAVVKVLCEIDMQFRNIIQEGHFSAAVPGRRVDYRVSFIPSIFGQKMVIRVLDVFNAPLHLPDLHTPAWMLEEIRRVSEGDSGMILVVGPTGSGKTTTLYATLRDCGTQSRNVVTIEDPVEIEIPNVTQVPVNSDQGNTFAALLRSMLRQDPDVIMVGEIRDGETAGIAVQAATTGHLVLSTLHARDTVGTVFRLLDLGVEPFMLASSLQIVIAQRLVRQLCPYCKRAMEPTAQQLERMGPAGQDVTKLFVPAGCPSCLKTGYAGRRAIFEMLYTTDALRDAILRKAGPRELEEALAGTRFVRLMQTGYQLVAQGITAFDEVEKVVGR